MRTAKLFRYVLILVLSILTFKAYFVLIIGDATKQSGLQRDTGRHSKEKFDVFDLLSPPSQDNFTCVGLKITDLIMTPICTYESKDDRFVSGALISGKMWQKEHIDVLRALFEEDPELNLIDIGANLGTWTIVAAGLGRRVIAVEPFPPTLSRLHKSLQMGHFESRVVLVTSPLSDKYEEVTFSVNRVNKGGIAIKPKEEQLKKRSQKFGYDTVKQTTTLDDLTSVIPDGFKKAFMKIDIEAMELRVLNRSEIFLSAVRVPVMTLEWTSYAKRLDSPEVRYFVTWLKRMNYYASIIRVSPIPNAKLTVDILGDLDSDIRWGKIGDIFLIKKKFYKKAKGLGRIV